MKLEFEQRYRCSTCGAPMRKVQKDTHPWSHIKWEDYDACIQSWCDEHNAARDTEASDLWLDSYYGIPDDEWEIYQHQLKKWETPVVRHIVIWKP